MNNKHLKIYILFLKNKIKDKALNTNKNNSLFNNSLMIHNYKRARKKNIIILKN